MSQPIIIIGAGAAGLMAACDLSAAGLPVILLEAKDQPGGRIFSLQEHGFTDGAEAGAEFVHGHLPLTLNLLKEGNISFTPTGGKMVRVSKGKKASGGGGLPGWDQLVAKMEEQVSDLPLAAFLGIHFPGDKFRELRASAKRFAEGFDLADIDTVSSQFLAREWSEEDEQEYRVEGGYSRLIYFLSERLREQGGQLYCNWPVKSIEWKPGWVEVSGADGRRIQGGMVITAVSLGMLRIANGEQGGLAWLPSIPRQLEAARSLGFGSVIKVLIEFKEIFWDKGIGFIISDEKAPTWWTQCPTGRPLLTAWLTADPMRDFRALDESARLSVCLESLASIFSKDISFLQEQLGAFYVADWDREPYVRGGYSFETVGSEAARQILLEPVEGTLLFCGEALYAGSSPSTVEAALCSGRDVAGRALKLYKRNEDV